MVAAFIVLAGVIVLHFKTAIPEGAPVSIHVIHHGNIAARNYEWK